MVRLDPIRKAKVKKALKEGKNAKQSLLEADYKPSYADHSTTTKCVQVCQQEILQELKAKDVSVDYLLTKTNTIIEKAENKGDLTNCHRGIENIARFVGIDQQKAGQNTINIEQLNIIDPEILTKLGRNKLNQGQ